jgi:DNA-binding NtrC family response regulator
MTKYLRAKVSTWFWMTTRISAQCMRQETANKLCNRCVPTNQTWSPWMSRCPSGFEVLQNANMERLPVIVFVTAHDKYAIEAFEVQAVDYVLKPYTLARLSRAIERAKSLVPSNHSRLDTRVLAVLEQIANDGLKSGLIPRWTWSMPSE